MAMVTPRIVRAVRSLWRKHSKEQLEDVHCSRHLYRDTDVCAFFAPRVVGHHDNSLTDSRLSRSIRSRFPPPQPVESPLAHRNQDGWVGDNGAGNGDALLLPSGELTGIMIIRLARLTTWSASSRAYAALARKTGEQ